MRNFRSFLAEEYHPVLDSAPSVPEEQRWLSDIHIRDYTSNPDEVRVRDLGMKVAHADMVAHKWSDHNPKHMKDGYAGTELQHVPLDKIHYYQPSVNREKVRYFIKHFHLDPDKVHTNDGELREYEAPFVDRFHLGNGKYEYETADHHRLIAATLRGDTHAIARVRTWELKRKSDYKHPNLGESWFKPGWKQVKTERDLVTKPKTSAEEHHDEQ